MDDARLVPSRLPELSQHLRHIRVYPPQPALSGHWFQYMVAVEPGRNGRWMPRPRVRERTWEAALAAVRRLDPTIQERAIYAVGRPQGQVPPEPPVPQQAQVFPSELNLTFIYIAGASNSSLVHIVHRGGNNWQIPGI